MKALYLIPARGGSKGIPGKNLKLLNGKPLIQYSIELAQEIADAEDICISTDSDEIIAFVKKTGLKVPFKRPGHLATDSAGSFDVILHSLQFYRDMLGRKFDSVILLQPTSPLRKKWHIEQALDLFTPEIDMVVSVYESDLNPYYNLYEPNEYGCLKVCKKSSVVYTRRQDVPKVFAYNGAIFIINVKSIYQYRSLDEFPHTRYYEMQKKYSVDLDTLEDWKYCECLLRNEGDKGQ